MLKRFNKKGDVFQQFIMECIRCGSTLLHLGHQLAEWTSAVKDFEAYAGAVHRPNDQMSPTQWKAFVDTPGNKGTKRKAFEAYMAHALAHRATRARTSAAASAPAGFQPAVT